MTVGENIRQCRKERGMTQADLAAALHIQPQGVSQWERNIRTPQTESLVKIAHALNVNIEDLAGVQIFESEEEFQAEWERLTDQKDKQIKVEHHVSSLNAVQRKRIEEAAAIMTNAEKDEAVKRFCEIAALSERRRENDGWGEYQMCT